MHIYQFLVPLDKLSGCVSVEFERFKDRLSYRQNNFLVADLTMVISSENKIPSYELELEVIDTSTLLDAENIGFFCNSLNTLVCALDK